LICVVGEKKREKKGYSPSIPSGNSAPRRSWRGGKKEKKVRTFTIFSDYQNSVIPAVVAKKGGGKKKRAAAIAASSRAASRSFIDFSTRE